MKNLQRFLAFLFVIVFLSSLTLSPALGSEQLPWDVERIRSYCVWDNDNWNMTGWNTTAWDVDAGANAGQGIAVAVIDTGMDYTVANGTFHVHSDLAANVAWMYGFKYDSGNPYLVDVYDDPVNQIDYIKDSDPWLPGHGTQVAGVIAATINGAGVIGAAPNVTIYSLKLDSINYLPESHSAEEAAAAINYSITLGIKVICISIGWNNNNTDFYKACNYALSQGVLLIAAAGNLNNTVLGYPASYSSVIAVGATDHDDNRAWFSNYGPLIWFVAPGVDINTTTLNGGYTTPLVEGTSFSAPLVTATAAMIWASKQDPNFGSSWNNYGVWAKMVNTTLDLPPLGKDNNTGWGLVNAWLANQRPVGNINGLDNKTDGKDIALAALHFGAAWGGPNWDPRADVNIDKKVDGKDIAIIALHNGEVDP